MENEVTIIGTCNFIKEDGERCGAQKLVSGDFCFFHEPKVIDIRQDARRKGGLNRYGPKGEAGSYTIKSPADVLTVLEDALNDTMALGNTTGRAKTIAGICQIILKGFEVTEFEGRLKALESKVRGHSK
jgi:hypothetical protein